jgi:short-subunit dehydrogenase
MHGFLEALRTEMLDSQVNVMWVCPGFTASNIRNTALNKAGGSQGQSPMDEGKMMSSEKCAEYVLKAIAKRKRTLVLTFKGKQTVFLNKFFPSLADKLTKNFFFKKGELVR